MTPRLSSHPRRSNFPVSCAHGLWFWLAFLLLSVPLSQSAQKEASGKPPEFRNETPLAAVRQAAQAADFQLSGFAPMRQETKLRAGDALTLLVTRSEGRQVKQWLIELMADETGKADSKVAAESVQFHTSSGNTIRLGGGRAALKLRVIGPLERRDEGHPKATAPRVEQRRITVSPEYLGLGLDQLPAMMLRWQAASKANPLFKPFEIQISSDPYPESAVAAARRQMAERGESAKQRRSDETAFIGTFLAMQEFFATADSTPGLQDVLRSVMDIPWWSVISRGGKVDVNFEVLPMVRELSVLPWLMPRTDKVYALPFQLRINKTPALVFQVAVTRPRPPLLVSAGAVGFAAGPVSGKGPSLTFQVLSTRSR